MPLLCQFLRGLGVTQQGLFVAPMKLNPLFSLEFLNECFVPDFEAGTLTWKLRPRSHFPTSRGMNIANALFAGKLAGNKSVLGYWRIYFGGQWVPVHRILWKMRTGEDPKGDVDHINGDRADNRICNLREATRSQNKQNERIRLNNTSGFKNVSWNGDRKMWAAIVMSKGKNHFFGYFDDPEEASKAAQAARERLHGDFANHG